MNVVALRALPSQERFPPLADRQVARVAIFDDLAAAKPYWRDLEQSKSLATPYQRYEFLKQWQNHVGAQAGVTPFVVVGFNAAGEPLFLWPLGRRRLCGLRVIEFLGGKHANFNMGLWRCDLAPRIAAAALKHVVAQFSDQADLVMLVNQPLTWAGTTNPFGLLPHQRAVNFGFSGALTPDFEALLRAHTNSATRKKLRKKERDLAAHGEVRFARAIGATEERRVLDTFFKQKSARMRALGLHDVFAAPGVRRFIEAAATEPTPEGKPPIELYSLSVDDIIVATIGGIVGGGRFCGMFNSIISDRFAAESPGEQLIVHLVRHCCERGLKTFDLGVGESRYKGLFCPDAEPLFDTFLPLSPVGRTLAHALKLAAAIKRTVKQFASLWAVVRCWRWLRAKLSPGP